MNMKLLSENMLRFGTKNLPESAKQRLVLESIMQTIHENDLAYEVSNRLSEGDEETEVNGWFRVVKNNSTPQYLTVSIYPTLHLMSYLSGGQAKINQGYYNGWVKQGATEANSKTWGDIFGIYYPAIEFNMPKNLIKEKTTAGLDAALQAAFPKLRPEEAYINISMIGTGAPQGANATAAKKLAAKTSTYTYYSYRLKKNVTGGVPCADASYAGYGKGSIYQLALEAAAAFI